MGVVIKGNIDSLMNSNNKGIMGSQMKISDVLNFYKIDKSVNRDLAPNRIPKIVKYLEDRHAEIGIFFPSFVFSYRGDPSDYYDFSSGKLNLEENIELVVLDGQHRIKSMEMYVNRIKDDRVREEFLNNYLTVQIYFGLSFVEERNLFIDINSNAKKVSRSLITKYDSRDIMNILVTELYTSSIHLQTIGVEFAKGRIVRPKNTTFITSMRLKNFISYLLYGKKSLNSKEEKDIKNCYDDVFNFLIKFFHIMVESLPIDLGDVLKYILGHESTQNAIALYFNNVFIMNDDGIKWLDDWESEVEQLEYIDWSVKNKKWKDLLIENNPGSKKNKFQSIPSQYMKEVYQVLNEELS